ncbi:MAG TPA: fibronectin type III domain-containing protein, partial [Mycobacteriales bacterium]|nr:fibronectin type III domain-containing protein [Mycobacteriales bacterium]
MSSIRPIWARVVTAGIVGIGVAAAVAAPAAAGPPTQLYVAPAGTGSACSAAAPCSLETAQAHVRSATGSMKSDIVVNLGSGTYHRSAPWQLSAAAHDGGTHGHRVIYQAAGYGTAGQATPTFSGGRDITGWKLTDPAHNVWQAPAPGLKTRQLYVDDQRALRAGQDSGIPGTVTTTKTGYTTTDTSIQKWTNPGEIEFVYRGGENNGNFQWAEPRCQVKSITGDANSSTITMSDPCFRYADGQRSSGLTPPTSIENVPQLLDSPGEWYLDEHAGTISYIPRAGEDMSTAKVVAPVAESLLEVTGTADHAIENLSLRGITFADATWLGPSSDLGFPDDSYNMIAIPLQPGEEHSYFWSGGVRNVQMHSNITLTAAHNVLLEGDTFTRLGGAGVTLDDGSQHDAVRDSVFTDISGQAVQVGNVDKAAQSGPWLVTDNTVENNYFKNVAAEYHDGYAVWNAAARRTTVDNNLMTDLPRGGIASNHVYSYGDTVVEGDRFERNIVTDYAKVINDGGGFDTNGTQSGPHRRGQGTILAGNVFSHEHKGFGQIYLDFHSADITVQNNVSYDNSYRSSMLRIVGSDTGCCNIVKHNYWDKAANWGQVDDALDNPVLPVDAMPASIMAAAGPEPSHDAALQRAARTTALSTLDLPNGPQPAAFGAPTGVTVSAPHAGPSATLSWTAPGAGVTGYEVACSTADDPDPLVMAAVPGDRTSAKVDGLRPGTRYSCVVRGRDEAGAISPDSVKVTIAVPGPDGLVGQWNFDDTGAVATDSSGSKNDADLWKVVGFYDSSTATTAGGAADSPFGGGEQVPSAVGNSAISGMGDGTSATFAVTAPSAGQYTLDFRYSASREGAWLPDGSRTMSLYVNDQKVDQVQMPWTGSWSSFSNFTYPIDLKSGANSVSLRVDDGDKGWIILDYLSLLQPAPDRVAGAHGQALPLDGTEVAWPGDSSVLGFTNSGFSLKASVKTTASGTQRLVSKGFYNNGVGYALSVVDGKPQFAIGSNAAADGTRGPDFDSVVVTGASAVNDGKWHQLVATYDQKADVVKLYVDGVAQSLSTPDNRCGTADGTVLDTSSCVRFKGWSFDPVTLGGYLGVLDQATGALDD